MDKFRIVVLAAGLGTRMEGELPKALIELRGKPMIKWLLEAVKISGIDPHPVVVVGDKKELVMEALGNEYEYAIQEKPLGTGHAVMNAEKTLKGKAENIIVLYSDSPLVSPDTIKNLAQNHLASGSKITMAIATLPDFENWRSYFYRSFSRIIRDENGNILKDVQFRDATEEEKKITEVNPCYFCFEAHWLWEKLKTLKTDNDQKEYYLTDLVKMATAENIKIESIQIDPKEALGVNNRQELEILESLAV